MANYTKSSFLDDFELPEITHEAVKQKLLKVSTSQSIKRNTSFESMPLEERLKMVERDVLRILGRYKGFVKIIRTKEELHDYISKAIENDYMAFDTETNNSLDALTCKLVGLCMYMPNTRPVYVPMNHCKPGTDERLENQITEDEAKEELLRLKENSTKLVYHNGKFDIRVCYNTLGFYMPIWWDTMIASQMLNEDDLAKLKYQYKTKIDATAGSYDIEHLFKGLPYAWVDPDIFSLYAAIDAYDTSRLQKYQQRIFEQKGMERFYNLFLNIEMKVVPVVAEMEDNGICVDLDFLKKLDTKYRDKIEKINTEINKILEPYQDTIQYYQGLGQLDTPINLDSTKQLPLLLYDIMKIPTIDGAKSTQKETLQLLNVPITKALLEYRHYSKLVNSFTTPLAEWLSKKDGKLHANFNQLGKEENSVRTGRFSSSEPNLQQIPSHGDDMRMIFKASPGNVIVGADYSQQEPRILTHICGDENLRETYNNGKDLYATIGSFIYHKDYWECMEHWEDGTPNPDGKALRSKCKQLVLGTMYGMGAKLMASNMGVSVDECKSILDSFFKMFPKVKEFTVQNEKTAKEIGYVEDYMGRRRHLPDAQKSEIEVKATKDVITNADVCIGVDINDCKVEIADEEAIKEWTAKWLECEKSGRFNAKKQFKEDAQRHNIKLQDNGAFISKSMTQCTNARIQGSAASLTKKAMAKIHSDKTLRELGFKILIPVHDELLGECPKENSEQVEKRLAQLMIEAGQPECSVKMKVDTYVVCHWYQDEVNNIVFEMYQQYVKGNPKKNIPPISEEEAVKKLCERYPELLEKTIRDICNGTFDVLSEEI